MNETLATPASSPFVGLRPFDAKDHHLFFGREKHVDRVLTRLRDQRFLAVVGMSGSGKSSLVRAGLLPRLERTFAVGGRCCWRFAMLRPGSDPIGALASALLQSGPESNLDPAEPLEASAASDSSATRNVAAAQHMRASLLRSSLALSECVRRIGLDEEENLLIVIDQFEELFRFRRLAAIGEQDHAAHFVSLLLEASARVDVPIFVVVTMRSDFLGDCARLPMLAEAINRGQYLVSFLSRRHREEAIVNPLRAFGLSIEPKLLHRLHDDTRNRDDQLPVLQHALMRTYGVWKRRVAAGADTASLAYEDYETAGGMTKAMSDHANQAMLGFSKAEHRVIQLLFRALTERGDDGRAVRRPCKVSEVIEVAGAELELVARIVQAFSEADERHFLVVTPKGPLTRESKLDLAHESLMRVWDLYVKWAKREVADAGQLRRLQELNTRYEQGEAGLLQDPELGVVLKWLTKAQPSAAWARRYDVAWEPVGQFIDDSRAAERARLQREEDRLAEERAAQRRRVWELRRNLAIASVLLAIAVAAIIWGYRNKQLVADREAAAAAAIADKERAEEDEEVAVDKMNTAVANTKAAEKDLEAAEKDLEAAEKKLTAVRAERETLALEQQLLRIEFELSGKVLAMSQTQLLDAQSALADAATQYARAKTARAKAESDKAEAEKKRDEAESEVAVLDAQLEPLRKAIEDAQTQLTTVNAKLTDAEKELEEKEALEKWRKEFGNVPPPGGSP